MTELFPLDLSYDWDVDYLERFNGVHFTLQL